MTSLWYWKGLALKPCVGYIWHSITKVALSHWLALCTGYVSRVGNWVGRRAIVFQSAKLYLVDGPVRGNKPKFIRWDFLKKWMSLLFLSNRKLLSDNVQQESGLITTNKLWFPAYAVAVTLLCRMIPTFIKSSFKKYPEVTDGHLSLIHISEPTRPY